MGGARRRLPRIEPMPDALSRDEVAHLADLARIDLTAAELDHLAPQLSVILESVASIQGVAGDDVPPSSHPLPLTNVFREDVVEPCLTPEQALSGAPEAEQQRFAVPRILGDEQ
jgi:aspartyl-tRNA(Asn)/glutamyl-tRNA(Gln) amidotransferase subunit C